MSPKSGWEEERVVGRGGVGVGGRQLDWCSKHNL